MTNRIQPILMLLIFSFMSHPSSLARADGGAVRLRERAGGYQIAVFTSPTPLRVGPVDVSVLVQDAATEECLPEARVAVRLTARGTGEVLEYSATTEAATNKLLRAAEFQLSKPGWWDVAVAVEGSQGPALVRFELQANEPPPRWMDLWPWFSWPALAIALFGVHQTVVLRKSLPVSSSASTGSLRSRNAAF